MLDSQEEFTLSQFSLSPLSFSLSLTLSLSLHLSLSLSISLSLSLTLSISLSLSIFLSPSLSPRFSVFTVFCVSSTLPASSSVSRSQSDHHFGFHIPAHDQGNHADCCQGNRWKHAHKPIEDGFPSILKVSDFTVLTWRVSFWDSFSFELYY